MATPNAMKFVPVQTGKAICRTQIVQETWSRRAPGGLACKFAGLLFQIGWSSFAAPFEFSTLLS